MTLLCLDGVVPSAIPPSPLALGYVDGDYVTYGALVATGHHQLVVPITVTRSAHSAGAILADVETGDLTPREAAAWALDRLKINKRPAVYGTQDSINAVQAFLEDLRVRSDLCDYFLARWRSVGVSLADVGKVPSVPTGYCGWQFAGNVTVPGGHSIDVSSVTPDFATRHGWHR